MHYLTCWLACRASGAARGPRGQQAAAASGGSLRGFFTPLAPVTNGSTKAAVPAAEAAPEPAEEAPAAPPACEDTDVVILGDSPPPDDAAAPLGVADSPEGDAAGLAVRRSARSAHKRRVIVVDSDSDGDKGAAHGAKASSGDDGGDDDDGDAPPPKRRVTRRASGAAAAQGEAKQPDGFFLKPGEKKQRKREAQEAAAAAAAQEAAVAAARAREDALAALRRERAEMRQIDASWNEGRTVHQFFSLNARAAAAATAAAGGADAPPGDAAAPVSMTAVAPPWAPVHVGLLPTAAGAMHASLPWPPGMLAPPQAQRPAPALAGVALGVLALPGVLAAAPPQQANATEASAPVDIEAALEALDEYLHAPRHVSRRGSDAAATEWEDEAQGDASAKGLRLQRLRARLQALTLPGERGGEDDGCWWCVRHAPRCASDVLCSGTGVAALRQWLASWKAAACGGDGACAVAGDPHVEISTESRSLSASPPRAAKRHRRPDYGDFVGESSDDDGAGFIDDGSDEEEEDGDGAARRMPRPAFVLSGPPGCGKTAAIYAVACELGFSVIEVGANAPRAGADVLSRVGEATQSRRVKNAGLMAGALQAPALVTGGGAPAAKPKPGPPSRRRAVILDDSSEEEEELEEADIVAGGDAELADGPNANQASGDHTIILFDEADLLWHQDRGFAGAMAQLAGGAKRPLVMTVNDPAAVLHALPPRLHVHHSIGRLTWGESLDGGVAHLTLVAAAEGRACSPQVAAAVLAACDGDIRRALTQLQVLTLPGGHGHHTFRGGLADTACKDELAAWKLLPTWQPAQEADPAGAASLAAAASIVLARVETAARAAAEAHVAQLAAAAEAAQAAKAEALRAAKAAKRALRAAERAAEDCDVEDAAAEAQDGAAAPEAEGLAAAQAPVAEAACTASGDDAAAPAAEDAPAADMETHADGGAEAAPVLTAAAAVPLQTLLASAGITVDTRCPDMQLDVTRVASLSELTACLSDAAAMRCPAVVTCTGPRLPMGDSCPEDDTLPPEMVYDASSPECGLDGGQPRGQLGGGAGTADLCSGSLVALATRLARQSAGVSDVSPHVALSAVPSLRLLSHVDSRREVLNDLGVAHSVLASAACAADCLAFAGRMARLETVAAPAKALGRRRRAQARVRHIACDEEHLADLLAASQFDTATQV